MTLIIGLLINLIVLAIIVVVVLWVLDLVASSIGWPPKITALLKALIILLALLIFVSALTGGWSGFYPVHHAP